MQAASHGAEWHPGGEYRLKGSASGAPQTPEAEAEQSLETREPETPLCCARCGHPVTRERHRIAVSGRHAHTRVNPFGIVFHFGCFALAEGCTADGPPTAEETWFPGFLWQVAHCSACHTHLGWCFRGDGAFFGLLLDRLTLPS
ncbi:cereblon family protein [Pyxidicoccus xibeiensis]|uniref:cereblon family protein n=1 Tax=Pyxidicoccus xibeiensis TaxID=2906759 RepID=UPI0020A75490|nr:cereblon family protein [Pyxidicoccus xibeiensis]MCP3142819.1 cereblon family protein [Pyxidicoccus xibeiensis]